MEWSIVSKAVDKSKSISAAASSRATAHAVSV